MSDVYVLNRNDYRFGNSENISLKKMLDVLKPILYDKKKKEGLIIGSSETLEYNKLMYTILGKNKKRAYRMQDELYNLLQVFGPRRVDGS